MAKKTQPPMQKGEDKTRLHLVVLRQMVTLATSGLGLVAALAWNSVIQDLVTNYINPYLPKGASIALFSSMLS